MQRDDGTGKAPDWKALGIDWERPKPEPASMTSNGEERTTAMPPNGYDGSERATGMPPQEYDDFARLSVTDALTSLEGRHALTAPGMPNLEFPIDVMGFAQGIDTPRPPLSGDLEAPIPTLERSRQARSEPISLDLDLSDFDDPAPREKTLPFPLPLPSPSMIEAALSPLLLAAVPITVPPPTPAVEAPHPPIIVEPGLPEWHEEVTLRDARAPEVRGQAIRPPTSDSIDVALDLITAPAQPPVAPSAKAIEIVSPRATPPAPRSSDPATELRDRYAVGDFTGAMSIAEAILAGDPSDAEALRFLSSCRDILMQMYTARVGSFDQIPHMILPADELRWLTLDHRAGFLLSCIDGISTVEELLDVSGMPPLDTLRILNTLIQQQVIEMIRTR